MGYAYGMTMTRKAKEDHLFEVKYSKLGSGLTPATFSSPFEIAKRDGRARMTTAEYVIFKMHRGSRRAEQVREGWTMARCTRRLRRTRTV